VHGICAYDEAGERRDVDLPEEIEGLCKIIEQMPNLKLVILDPIVSVIANDSHKNGDVRQGLRPLVRLAKKRGFAVLGITHFSKGTSGRKPLERVTGSLAFGAKARIVWVAAEDEEAKQNVLCIAKSNVGQKGIGWQYELVYVECETAPYTPALFVRWINKITGSAFAILSEIDSANEKVGALSDAKAFLLDVLSDGPVLQSEIEKRAKAEGISRRTLRRAKDSLGVKSVKEGFDGKWRWKLPENTQDTKGTTMTNQDVQARPKMSTQDVQASARNLLKSHQGVQDVQDILLGHVGAN